MIADTIGALIPMRPSLFRPKDERYGRGGSVDCKPSLPTDCDLRSRASAPCHLSLWRETSHFAGVARKEDLGILVAPSVQI